MQRLEGWSKTDFTVCFHPCSSHANVPLCASQGLSRCTWFPLPFIISILGTNVMWLVVGKAWKHCISKGMQASPLHDDPPLLLVLSCFCKLHGAPSPVELVWNCRRLYIAGTFKPLSVSAWSTFVSRRHARGHDKSSMPDKVGMTNWTYRVFLCSCPVYTCETLCIIVCGGLHLCIWIFFSSSRLLTSIAFCSRGQKC